MSDAFRVSISDTIRNALRRVSDRILKVEFSSRWPVAAALRTLAQDTELRLFVRQPFAATDFKGLHVTEDAGTATKWRNTKPRKYSILILGNGTGNLDAGLKDVRRIRPKAVIDRWCESTTKGLVKNADLDKKSFRKLLRQLFDDVSEGAIAAPDLQEFLKSIETRPTPTAVQKELYKVGLFCDRNVLDVGMTDVRLRRNRDLVDTVARSDDVNIDKLLSKKAKSSDPTEKNTALAVQSYRKSRLFKYLAGIELHEVEKLLKTEPKETPKTIDLFDLLNYTLLHRDGVKEAMVDLARSWKLDEPLTIIEASLAQGEEVRTVRLELSPTCRETTDEGEIPDSPWTGTSDETAIFAAQSFSAQPEGQASEQKQLTLDRLREVAGDLPPLDDFLVARSQMRQFEPWLEKNAFSLLLLHREAREATRKYIQAWVALATAVVGHDDAHAAIEAIQALETVQAHKPGDQGPDWIVLGPLHPFRIDPLLRAADEIVLQLDGQLERLGDAATWILDRSYPAYPTIHFKGFTLQFAPQKDLVCYRKNPTHFAPSLRDGAGLDRILRAIQRFSPWLDDGTSILVIDPPPGGGILRAFERAKRRFNVGGLHVYHLATSENSDTLDDLGADLRYLKRVNKLEQATELPPVTTVIRFAPDPGSASELAGPNWAATRGAHLALKIDEAIEGGVFGGTWTPKIVLDARDGNTVVRVVQNLFVKFQGGQPRLATIRPLLKTDDASALTQMAAGADWIVFAAPGPLGLVAPTQLNSTLRFVGRATSGNYGLYVYAADEMFAVRRLFEDYFKETPIALLPATQVVNRLVAKARDAGHAVLFASLGRVASQIGAMVALDIAVDDRLDTDETFVLSLDDLGWTRAWLGDGSRADFLVVRIRTDGSILFRVLESKSVESGEAIALTPQQPSVQEGMRQVSASLQSMEEITTAVTPSFEQDLRFASLMEHLMASALARSEEMAKETRRRIFQTINALSRREVTPEFEGLVVITQSGVNSPRTNIQPAGNVTVVWAGAPEIARVFDVPEGEDEGSESPEAGEPSGEVEIAAAESTAVQGGTITETMHPEESRTTKTVSSENVARQVALQFISAARIHNIPVVEPDPVYLLIGPSLIAFGMRLREGATIQPLKARLGDIARDIGLGDRAHEIDVDNDAEPRTVRVLVPKTDREFPSLPPLSGDPLTTAGYLPIYIGKAVDGKDYLASVESWPHMLVAGTTGSGKTTFIRSILRQLSSFGSQRVRVIVVDGKGDTDYLGSLDKSMFPAAFPDVQVGAETALDVLRWTIDEMEARREKLHAIAKRSSRATGIKAADIYREALAAGGDPELNPLVVVIDEFAEIMLASRRGADEFENLVQRISQVGRSRLIHLILATQRPDKETIRGAIKTNLDARAIFRLPTQADSFTVMGQGGAERLMSHGDMLFRSGGAVPIRLQAYLV